MSAKTILITAVAAFSSAVIAGNGDLTWFYPGLGACGYYDNLNEAVVALSPYDYDSGRNCGRWITIEANGRYTAGRVVDLCEGCSTGDVDASPVIFDDIAPTDVGRVHNMDWWFQ